jgi:hypothetical protein
MPAYNFRRQFSPLIVSGAKRCTIRPHRARRPTRPGDRLHLFTGMRTRTCLKLIEATCLAVEPIAIAEDSITLDGRELDAAARAELIAADGFDSAADFYAFFRKQYGLPVELELITWELAGP